MTLQAHPSSHDLGDEALIVRARAQDPTAIAELYERHHASALRLARTLVDPVTAEDVAAEAFARVMRALQGGRGPESAFRPYLLVAVRSVHIDHVRRDRRYVWVDEHDEDGADALPAAEDVAETSHDARLVAQAFRTLPERWQTVLWHSVVENDDHTTIGRLLGIKANAVAALAFRARDGLREAFLEAHLGTPEPGCVPTRGSLAGYARGSLRTRRRQAVESHLETCAACTTAVAELRRISRGTALLLGPGILGAAGAAYVTETWRAGGAVAVPDQAELASSAPGRARHAAVGAAAAVAVVLTAGGVYALTGDDASPGLAGADATTSDRAASGGVSASSPSGAPSPGGPVTGESPEPGPGPTAEPPSGVTPTTPVDPVDPVDPVVPPLVPPLVPTAPAVPAPDPTPPPAPEPPDRPEPPVEPPGEPPVEPPVGSQRSRADLSLQDARVDDLVDHRHFSVVVRTGGLPEVDVLLEVPAGTPWSVHTGPSWAVATCKDTTRGRLSCSVASDGKPLALDFVVDGALRVRASVAAPRNDDPRPRDNTAVAEG